MSEGLVKLRNATIEAIKLALSDLKVKMLTDTKEACPVDQSRMRTSITITDETNTGFTLSVPVDYASFVEEGTGRIRVGSVEEPRKTWTAKRKRQDTGPSTMPFIRPSWYNNRLWFVERVEQYVRGLL